MSLFTHRARLLLSAGLCLAMHASAVHAGLLDSWLAKKPLSPSTRGQSPSVAEETGFCADCDHNPNPRHTARCRHHCGQTYYPAIPPYCAPCYGVYPTCWRRLDECWTCPQERYTTKPKRRSEFDPLKDAQGVPPLPATGAPYVPSTPAADAAPAATDAPAAEAAPAKAPATEASGIEAPELEAPTEKPAAIRTPALEAPAGEPAGAEEAAQRVAPAANSQTRARADRVQPAGAQQPAPKPAARARSKSVEELIRELR